MVSNTTAERRVGSSPTTCTNDVSKFSQLKQTSIGPTVFVDGWFSSAEPMVLTCSKQHYLLGTATVLRCSISPSVWELCKIALSKQHRTYAGMVKLEATQVLGSCTEMCKGSSPFICTT